MINVIDEGVILKPRDLEFEQKGVLNPAAIVKDGITHMFYRAVNNKMVSSIGYCQLQDNKIISQLDHPVIFPEYDYEKMGTEDPRIILLDNTYYLFYTAYDGSNALVAFATSTDLITFSKHGLVTPKISYDRAEDIFRNSGVGEKYILFEKYYKELGGANILLWEKDVTIFPKKINGKFALIHRILPGIQVIYFDDFSQLNETSFWENYLKQLGKFIILDPKYDFENRNIGGGCPPIETPEGWLLIFHTIENTPAGNIYRASAALLDLNDPTKVIGRLHEPLFAPETSWEINGQVNNVVFPTGTILDKGRLMIYYGAADTVIAAKSVLLADLLKELKK